MASDWRKSSASGDNGGNCLEAATGPAGVLVRDSKDMAGVVLTFSPSAWREFGRILKTT
jgi:Domain of unknown function (DUF397)